MCVLVEIPPIGIRRDIMVQLEEKRVFGLSASRSVCVCSVVLFRPNILSAETGSYACD